MNLIFYWINFINRCLFMFPYLCLFMFPYILFSGDHYFYLINENLATTLVPIIQSTFFCPYYQFPGIFGYFKSHLYWQIFIFRCTIFLPDFQYFLIKFQVLHLIYLFLGVKLYFFFFFFILYFFLLLPISVIIFFIIHPAIFKWMLAFIVF